MPDDTWQQWQRATGIVGVGSDWDTRQAAVYVRLAQVGRRRVVVGLRIEHPDGLDPEDLDDVSLTRIEAAANAGGTKPPRPTRRDLRVKRPRGGGDLGDAFYAEVGRLYSACVAHGMSPLVEIAGANGVPQSSAARWVKESRRRGLLAPARKAGSR